MQKSRKLLHSFATFLQFALDNLSVDTLYVAFTGPSHWLHAAAFCTRSEQNAVTRID